MSRPVCRKALFNEALAMASSPVVGRDWELFGKAVDTRRRRRRSGEAAPRASGYESLSTAQRISNSGRHKDVDGTEMHTKEG